MRILLIDDDEGIRDIYSEMLTDIGFDVKTSGDGFDALSILAQDRDFKLIISDVQMPIMNGLEFAAAAADLYSHIPVILMSGFHTKAGNLPNIHALLAKPLDEQILITTIEKALKA
jgi:DNA-binding NtrC family response regulator